MYQVVLNSSRRLELTGPVAVGDLVDFRGTVWMVSEVGLHGAHVKPLPGDPEPERQRDAFADMRAKTRVDRDIARVASCKPKPYRVIPDWVAALQQERLPINAAGSGHSGGYDENGA